MLVKCLHCGLPETWMSSSVVVMTVGVGGAYGSNRGSALERTFYGSDKVTGFLLFV